MKKIIGIILSANLLINILPVSAAGWINDNGTYTSGKLINDIPTIDTSHIATQTDSNYEFIPGVAQYKLADWSHVIGRAHNVTVEQAKQIANADSNITYFFYVTGGMMVLENNTVKKPYARVFTRGDAVFFSGTPWWGSAPGLADGYVKTNVNQN